MAELANRSPEGAFGRKRPDVQLVDDRLLPGAAGPVSIAPRVGSRIDHLARAVHVLRLIARSWVGDAQPDRQCKAISRSRAGAICDELVPARADCFHSNRLAV